MQQALLYLLYYTSHAGLPPYYWDIFTGLQAASASYPKRQDLRSFLGDKNRMLELRP